MMRRRALRALAFVLPFVLVLGSAAPAARAQGVRAPSPSTSSVAPHGDVEATERTLFEAARRAPRDPSARVALGSWLAARGQLRAGAVLLEEARLFGGDAPAIAARLAHVYTWLGDWASLAALPASPLSPVEKERARLLADRAADVEGPDSTVVPFAPMEVGALGRMPLVIGSDTLWGEVDPQEEGLVLPGLARGAGLVEMLGNDRRGAVGIVRESSLGELTLHNLPARLDATLGVGRARLGFDVFARLAPTVDARSGTVTLRRAGRVGENEGASAVPVILGFPGVLLALRVGDQPVAITSPAGRAALRGRRWTVDLRRGAILAEAAR